MFLNPVCHWGGGSDLLQEWDFSAPPVQPFPASSAEMVALGLPAPTALWKCDESVSPLADGVGSVDLTQGTLGTQAEMGLVAGGFWNGTDVWSKKCIDFKVSNRMTFLAASNASLDPGSGSFAALIVWRGCYNQGSSDLIGKRAPGLDGWQIFLNGSGPDPRLILDGSLGIQTISITTDHNFAWHCALAVVDRNTGFARLYTDLAASASTAITCGDLTNTGLFSIGAYHNSSLTSPDANIAYAAYWQGAAAEGMGQADLDAFWKFGTDPNGLGQMRNTNVNQEWGTPVGDHPTTGEMLADYAYNAIPIGWDAGLSNPNEMGLYCLNDIDNIIVRSDDLQFAWSKVNINWGTRAAGTLTADICPRGDRSASTMQATANAAYVQILTNTTASRRYTFAVYLKRRTGYGSDVACRLVQYDNVGGAEVASVAVTATSKWQRFSLTAQTNVGQVNTGWRIEIVNSGDEISMYRASAFRGEFAPPIMTDGALVTEGPPSYEANFAAGSLVSSLAGELEIIAKGHEDQFPEFSTCHLFYAESNVGLNNAKYCAINALSWFTMTIFDNVGGSDTTLTAAQFYGTEKTYRFQWDSVNPIIPGWYSLIRIDAAVTNGDNAGWATAETIDTLNIGGGVLFTQGFMGMIPFVRSYSKPQP